MKDENNYWGDSDHVLDYFAKNKVSEKLIDFPEQFAERLRESKINPIIAEDPKFRELLTSHLQVGCILCVSNSSPAIQSTAILNIK